MRAMSSHFPRIVLHTIVVLIVAGIASHGVGIAEFRRIWEHIVVRPSDTLALRFLLQPTMSTIISVRDGIKDAQTDRSPYFWTILSNPDKRRERLREGAAATGKIILLAVLLDGIYQYIAFKSIYPVEAVVVAILLAFVPYFLIRGPVARIARRWNHAATSDNAR
jgi:hypothetical protein